MSDFKYTHTCLRCYHSTWKTPTTGREAMFMVGDDNKVLLCVQTYKPIEHPNEPTKCANFRLTDLMRAYSKGQVKDKGLLNTLNSIMRSRAANGTL